LFLRVILFPMTAIKCKDGIALFPACQRFEDDLVVLFSSARYTEESVAESLLVAAHANVNTVLNEQVEHKIFKILSRVKQFSEVEVCFGFEEAQLWVADHESALKVLEDCLVALLGQQVLTDEISVAEQLEEIDGKAGRVPEESLFKQLVNVLGFSQSITSTDASNTKVL